MSAVARRSGIPATVNAELKVMVKNFHPLCPYCNTPVVVTSAGLDGSMVKCHIRSHRNNGKEIPTNLIVGHNKCNRQAGKRNLKISDFSNRLWLGTYWKDNWERRA